MTIAQDIAAQDLDALKSESELSESTAEEIQWPPGNLESKEPPLESELHLRQILE
ncbi:MAG: hypothetical protein ACFBSC_10500 [Microcoleaceae cyanobacterium]